VRHPVEVAETYRLARVHLTKTALLTVVERDAVAHVFEYCDLLERLIAGQQNEQFREPLQLLAAIALQQPDGVLRVQNVELETLPPDLTVQLLRNEAETAVVVQSQPTH
jgi:hypothetical protein